MMAIRTKKIFVVDDDEMLTTMLSDHLQEKPNYEVHVYSTGEECLKQLHLNPDAIILDMNLSTTVADAGDGLEILQQIKKRDRAACVIILSGQTHYGKAAQAIAKGAFAYVMKDEQAFRKLDDLLEAIS